MTSWMSNSEYWKSEPDKVHGIYIEDVPITVASNDKKPENLPIPLPNSTTTPVTTPTPSPS